MPRSCKEGALDSVYAVVFDNNTVKFGMSVDAERRFSDHRRDAARHNVSAQHLLIATVDDMRRREINLLSEASYLMEHVSGEVFKFKKLHDVYDVFRASDLEPFIFAYRAGVGLVLDKGTFTGVITPASKMPTIEIADRCYTRLIDILCEGRVHHRDIVARCRPHRKDDVLTALSKAVNDGYAENATWAEQGCRFTPWQLSTFRLTPKGVEKYKM